GSPPSRRSSISGRTAVTSRCAPGPETNGGLRPSDPAVWPTSRLSAARSTSTPSTSAPARKSGAGRDRRARQGDIATVDEAPLEGGVVAQTERGEGRVGEVDPRVVGRRA